MKTFEELHPDTIAYIKEHNLVTTVYERCVNSELIEKWEKINGTWKDVTKKALLEKEIEEANHELTRYRVALRLKKF